MEAGREGPVSQQSVVSTQAVSTPVCPTTPSHETDHPLPVHPPLGRPGPGHGLQDRPGELSRERVVEEKVSSESREVTGGVGLYRLLGWTGQGSVLTLPHHGVGILRLITNSSGLNHAITNTQPSPQQSPPSFLSSEL